MSGLQIVVPRGMQYPQLYRESNKLATPSVRLGEVELARATLKLPVTCTDCVLVDSERRFVLAKRRHAAAMGWWWKGGGLNQDRTPEMNLAGLLKREIGYVPPRVVYLQNLFHYWDDTRERPGFGRLDNIYLHVCMVSREDIDRITLDPDEYDVSAGFLYYDGTQSDVRPVVMDNYGRFQRLYHEQPDLFANG